jgi:hypothetical protein
MVKDHKGYLVDLGVVSWGLSAWGQPVSTLLPLLLAVDYFHIVGGRSYAHLLFDGYIL